MRLTCPNCGARYEVDDSMIPPEGRDVQCSECSTTWFQPGRVAGPPDEPALSETGEFLPDGDEEWAEEHEDPDQAAPEREPGPSVRSDTPDSGQPNVDAASPEVRIPASAELATQVVPPNDAPEEEEPREAAEAATGRRDMDPAVRNILREEAEREARLRRSAADPVETQSEMPLDEEPQEVARARRRAELEDAEDAFSVGEGSAGATGTARRELLPDIEEINSTLRAHGTPEADAHEDEEEDPLPVSQRRRGVRIGFLLTLAVAAGLFWVYLNADLLTERAPGIAPAVEAFAARVDAARFWLDDVARDLVATEGGAPPQ